MPQQRLGARQFAKYHALGNDYLVVDAARFGARLTANRVRALCDRQRGPGADGVLALVPSRGRRDFGLRIYNPDGSQAEKSGNGLRILARFVYDHGYTRRRAFSIETPGGPVEARLSLRGGRVGGVTVEMGHASFASREVGARGPAREMLEERRRVHGESVVTSCCSLGNPHCVVFVPRLEREELLRLGPALETHADFPRRINVQLARVRTRRRVDVRVWERGAGETQASGSSSCAVAAVGVRLGRLDPRVTVHLPGGDLRVEVGDDFALRLTGPVTPVYQGTLL